MLTNISEIFTKAQELFGELCSKKLFSRQLNYFDDINFDEQVEFMPDFEVSEQEVKGFLIDAAITGF